MLAWIHGGAVEKDNKFLEKISDEEIYSKLIKGQTTKEQVKLIFGEPEKVNISSEGKENWLYYFIRGEGKGINYIPMYHGTNNNMRELKILFDTNGIVELFTLQNSTFEAESGLFL